MPSCKDGLLVNPFPKPKKKGKKKKGKSDTKKLSEKYFQINDLP